MESNFRFYSSSTIADEQTFISNGLDEEILSGLDCVATNLQTIFQRRFSSPTIQHRDGHRTGWFINGSFFDDQIFQSNRSSCIFDYDKIPNDLTQYLDSGRLKSSGSSLDLHLFKLAFVLTLSDEKKTKLRVLDYCPHEDSTSKEIVHYRYFCFPESNKEQLLNELSTYVFTRTSAKGHVEYGYCRRVNVNCHQTNSTLAVLCIVSSYPFYKLYDGILNELANAFRTNQVEFSLLMQSFYSKPLPKAIENSSGITCVLNNRRLFFHVCPRDQRLNHNHFSVLLSCLSPGNIVHLFQAILTSKRLLVYSQSLSKLTQCCLALISLIYPFLWPYSFASVIPVAWLQELIHSPCPFIYGCLSESRECLGPMIDSDILQIDLDSNTIDGELTDDFQLPFHLQKALENSLAHLSKFRLRKLDPTLINIAVSEACLNILTELFYRLPDFLRQTKNLEVSANHFSVCSNYFKVDHLEIEQLKDSDSNNFNVEEFLQVQSIESQRIFLKEFTRGMMFLKFLDDYHQCDQMELFSQRLNERRRIDDESDSIDLTNRFRRTFDLLEKQFKDSAKSNKYSFSKMVKKLLD